MRQGILCVCITLIVSACGQSKIADPDYYEVLNQIIKSDQNFEVIIFDEPHRFHKPFKRLFDYVKMDTAKSKYLPTLQPFNTVDNLTVLVGWSIAGHLDSLEAEDMFGSQDSSLNLLLDKTKLKAKTITRKEIKGISEQGRLTEGKIIYKVSYPLYNKNKTKLILTVETIGGSNTYLFERKDDKWIIIAERKNSAS